MMFFYCEYLYNYIILIKDKLNKMQSEIYKFSIAEHSYIQIVQVSNIKFHGLHYSLILYLSLSLSLFLSLSLSK